MDCKGRKSFLFLYVYALNIRKGMEKFPYTAPAIRIYTGECRENILTVSHEGYPIDPFDPEIND